MKDSIDFDSMDISTLFRKLLIPTIDSTRRNKEQQSLFHKNRNLAGILP